MIRPSLRDLINDHKLITESNNEENEEKKVIVSEADRAEWKIPPAMPKSCISIRNFEET